MKAPRSTKECEIIHDADLLKKMMDDMASTPSLFQPTNYWKTYEDETIKYIETNGLDTFRSYSTSTLASFGAGTRRKAPLTSWFPKRLLEFSGYRHSATSARLFHVYSELVSFAESFAPLLQIFNIRDIIRQKEETESSQIEQLLNEKYRCSKLLDEASGLQRLGSVEDSLIGCPFDKFDINGKAYTLSFLRAYDHLAYVARQINVHDLGGVLDLGSGYGASAEVYVKALPDIAYYCCDIPPQLYVAQQYLSAVFPGKVYTYENYVRGEDMDRAKYRVFCIPSWALATMSKTDFGLFINTASFQEMEPEIVQNYYTLIRDRIKYAYLFQLTHGIYKRTSPSSGGSINPLQIDDYLSIFRDFTLLHREEFFRIQNPCTRLLLQKKPSNN